MLSHTRLCSFITTVICLAFTSPSDAVIRHHKHNHALTHIVQQTRVDPTVPPCATCSTCHATAEKPVCENAKASKHRLLLRASWYGPGFHGRRTASGERFNMHALTAAHRSLPLGSKVQVTNLRTGDTVVVKINDRGPYVRGRGIDLSKAAAAAINIAGVETVSVTLLN